MNRPSVCRACGGSTSEGFVTDNTYGAVGISTWVDGQPERSMWTGLKLRRRTKLAITTYRCTRCGLLESYAPAQP